MNDDRKTFIDAVGVLQLMLRKDYVKPSDPQLSVVHAKCKSPDGEIYPQAWVLHKDMVWQSVNIGLGPDDPDNHEAVLLFGARQFVHSIGMLKCTKYTLDQLVAKIEHHGNFGPWDSDLRKLVDTDSLPPELTSWSNEDIVLN